MIVSEVMSTKVVSVPPTAKYKEVWNAFVKHQLHALPVVDSHKQVVGIVTEVDLMQPVFMDPGSFSEEFSASSTFEEMEEKVKDLTKLTAQKVMNRRIVFTRPDTPMLRALSRMLIRKIRQMPVIDPEKGLVGFVTKRDIVDALVKRQFRISRVKRNRGQTTK
jgi:CBS domain-containing membrane protein